MRAWRYYANLYSGYYGGIIICNILAVLQAFLLVVTSLQIKEIFDRSIPTKDQSDIVTTGLIVAGLYLLGSAASVYIRYYMLKSSKRVIQRLRNDLIEKIFSTPYEEYIHLDKSQLNFRIVQETERIDIMSNALVSQYIPAMLIVLSLIGVLISFNWQISLGIIIPAMIFFSFIYQYQPKVKKRILSFNKTFDDFNTGCYNALQRFELAFLHSSLETEKKNLKDKADSVRVESYQMALFMTFFQAVQSNFLAFGSIILLIIGGIGIVKGWLSMGVLLSIYFIFILIKNNISLIINTLPQLLIGNQSLQLVFSLLNTKREENSAGHKSKIEFSGNIQFNDLSFSYGEKQIFEKINLKINGGSTIGIVGANGSGKSTLVKLIAGFYNIEPKTIHFETMPLENIDMPDFRTQIGVVVQKPYFFHDSIFKNITYGFPEVSGEMVEEASILATAHDFIMQLKDKYQTVIGENGVFLSGGELQKIAIARSLLRKPKLLILDEPTNHLDSYSLKKMIRNLKLKLEGTTILVFSHNEEVINFCKQVFILKDGKIEEDKMIEV